MPSVLRSCDLTDHDRDLLGVNVTEAYRQERDGPGRSAADGEYLAAPSQPTSSPSPSAYLLRDSSTPSTPAA